MRTIQNDLKSKLAGGLLLALLLAFTQNAVAHARQLFVSPDGDGSDGKTWKTAFKSPSTINWKSVNTGDIIDIDGGASGITYQGAVDVPVNNIVIRQSRRRGHSGQVTISGSGINPPAATGLTFSGSNIHVMGARRSGIKIAYFGSQIVKMQTNFNSLRNVELTRTTGYMPYAQGQVAGILYGGYGNRVLNCDIRDTWVNAVERPTDSGPNLTQFHNCTFGNNGYGWWGHFGTGIYGSRSSSNKNTTTYVSHCVFGPYFNDGIDFVQGRLSVSNCVFLGSALSNLKFEPASSDPGAVARINRCTFYEPNFSGFSRYPYKLYQISTNGNGSVRVRNSIVYGGSIHVAAGQNVNGGGNIQFRVTGNTQALAPELVDPQFVNDTQLSAPITATTIRPRTWTEQSYAINAGSPAENRGSTIVDITSLVPAYGPTSSLPPLGGP